MARKQVIVGLLKKLKFTTKCGTVKLVWPCPDTKNRVLCHWPVIAMGFFNSPPILGDFYLT